jgi:hypothetical protein
MNLADLRSHPAGAIARRRKGKAEVQSAAAA